MERVRQKAMQWNQELEDTVIVDTDVERAKPFEKSKSKLPFGWLEATQVSIDPKDASKKIRHVRLPNDLTAPSQNPVFNALRPILLEIALMRVEQRLMEKPTYQAFFEMTIFSIGPLLLRRIFGYDDSSEKPDPGRGLRRPELLRLYGRMG